jgi:transcriptional regulator with XRE-family HTH domain
MRGERMLCNRIKQFRTYNKIETKTLAKALNIEHSQYLKFETGEEMPDIDIITTLSKIYKVTVSEFYGHEPRMLELQNNDNPPLKYPDEYDALKFAELSIDEKELILAYRTSNNKEKFLKIIEDEEK